MQNPRLHRRRVAALPLTIVRGAAVMALLAGAAACATTPVGARPDVSSARSAGEATAADTFSVVLMGTTDVHGRIFPHDYYTGQPTNEGLARLKPLVDSIRVEHPGRTYLFDSGDLLQGNPLGYYYARVRGDEPNPIIRAMNLIGYDAAAIGNHEFNYGLAHLDRAIGQAGFPFVSANIFEHGTQRHAYTPYVLLPQPTAHGDTIVIGVTGNTPPGVHIWDRANVDGVLEFRDIVQSLERVVGEMRGRGADLVVVLSHGGIGRTSYDTVNTGLTPENVADRVAREVRGVDVIFLGHTHRELADSVITSEANPHGVLLTQARQWAQSLAVATVRMERAPQGRWRASAKQAGIVRPRVDLADRELMDTLRWQHERVVEYVTSRIGTMTERWDGTRARVEPTAIVAFVNNVMRRSAGAELAANAAFQLDAAFAEGDVTIADIARLYPYDNTLRAIRITGAQLRAYLEKSAEYYAGWPAPAGGTVTNFGVPGYNFDIVTGVEYTIDLTRPTGSRITELRHRGEPVRADQTFTMAISNYRQAGGGGYAMIADAPVVYDRGEDIRELLIEEVRRRGVLRRDDFPAAMWRIVPEAATDVAAREQNERDVQWRAQTAPVERRPRLRVLTTNDFHGRLLPERPDWAEGRAVGGAAALASYFAHERAGFGGPTILVDGGDVMQGTPISNLTEGRATVSYFNAAGYTAAAVGNHEFDWGIDVLRARMRQADFPWLSANVFVAGTDTAPSWAQATTVVELDGVRVGIVGLSTEETPWKVHAENVRGLEFRSGSAALDRWVPKLRADGVDFVIAIAHAGAYCDEAFTDCRGEALDWVAAATHRPDLFVGGHTHEVVRTFVNGTPVVESGLYGRRYVVVDLERIGADSVDTWIRGIPAAWTDRVQPDSAVAALVERYRAEVGPQIERQVATFAAPLERVMAEYALGRLIADAQRTAMGTQIAFMNTGGIRASVAAGPATWGELYAVQPFENRLVRLALRGADVRAALEHTVSTTRPQAHVSGVMVDFDPRRPVGSRLVRVTLDDGSPLRDDAVYTVTVNDFLAFGEGDGFASFANALERDDSGMIDLDALVAYLQSLPQPVRAPAGPRLRPVTRSRD
jgi:2',3'-cyclic-nucleotide 2'-phosphodiesterase / 3'-nucleotidase / 5'-nucleotidase